MHHKFLNILATLPHIANKSQINHQHSAVIIKNGTPIIWGFNNIRGVNTYHAEHDVIRKYLAMKCIKGGNEIRPWCLLRSDT
jgi:hypothetical protein